MAAYPPKIVIPKKLEETMRILAEQDGPEGRLIGEKYIGTARGLCRQLIARIDDARAKKEATSGMSPYHFIQLVRSACPTTVVPPNLEGALMGRIKQKVALLGLNDELVERAATRAKHRLRQPMSLLYFVNTVDTLIGEEDPEVTSGSEVRIITGRGD